MYYFAFSVVFSSLHFYLKGLTRRVFLGNSFLFVLLCLFLSNVAKSTKSVFVFALKGNILTLSFIFEGYVQTEIFTNIENRLVVLNLSSSVDP